MITLREYKPGELDELKDAFLASNALKDDNLLDDQTWHDMDMDHIMARIDTCASRAGQERLYAMLRKPLTDDSEIAERDSLIGHFSEDTALSDRYRDILSDLGNLGSGASVTLEKLSEAKKESSLIHYLCALLGIISIVMIFVSPSLGLLIFLIALIVNLVTYFKRRDEIGEYISCFSYVARCARAAKYILKIKDDESLLYRERLARATTELKGALRGSFLVTGGMTLTGGFINLFLDYVRMFFHLDLIVFNSMLKAVTEHKQDIKDMLLSLGDIDTYISIAEYRRSLPAWCRIAHDEVPALEATGLYHPLVENAVSSDIKTKPGVGILITGSNASGKSTFLRSVGLAAILGQTIATVCAESYKGPYYHIVSSMSVSDDVLTGESYYMAEVRAVKRLISLSDGDLFVPLLCFTDELLKGTNTVERIAASSRVLERFAKVGVTCFAATHDRELSDILASLYEDHHFEESMEGDDVKFSYRLMDGKACTRNAIKLLSVMGFEKAIVESAEESAEEFEKKGAWTPIK